MLQEKLPDPLPLLWNGVWSHVTIVFHTRSHTCTTALQMSSFLPLCDWEQNWMEWSKPFLRADQGVKVGSKLQKSKHIQYSTVLSMIKGSRCTAIIPIKKQVIKSFRKEQSSDQAQFLQIKIDFGHRYFNRRHISDYPLSMQSDFKPLITTVGLLSHSLVLEGLGMRLSIP